MIRLSDTKCGNHVRNNIWDLWPPYAPFTMCKYSETHMCECMAWPHTHTHTLHITHTPHIHMNIHLTHLTHTPHTHTSHTQTHPTHTSLTHTYTHTSHTHIHGRGHIYNHFIHKHDLLFARLTPWSQHVVSVSRMGSCPTPFVTGALGASLLNEHLFPADRPFTQKRCGWEGSLESLSVCWLLSNFSRSMLDHSFSTPWNRLFSAATGPSPFFHTALSLLSPSTLYFEDFVCYSRA